VTKVTFFAGGSDRISGPTEQHSYLSHIKRPRAALEHLWNTNVVQLRGRLVILVPGRCYAARRNSHGWGWLVMSGKGWRRGLFALPRV